MTNPQWQAAWQLYQSGSSFPPEQARSFLNRATDDPKVRNMVLAMLDKSPASESFDGTGLNRIGQKLGRYILTSLLGQGGMGEVYAARDPELNRSVAVKVLAGSTLGQVSPPAGPAPRVDRFIGEAKAASALNHPNIVTIYEVLHAPSGLAIVMEVVEGVALRQLCGSPVPVDRLLHLGEQTARALGAAHARGIVHCDIKPENLMVRHDGLVKVLDFGLARDLSSIISGSNVAGGTLRYMSPEQSRGESPSAASDVFSLGIVLFELATGVHPFESKSVFDGLKALNHTEPPLPSSLNPFLPEHMDTLILRMLAKDPELRPKATEVAQILGSRLPGMVPQLPPVRMSPEIAAPSVKQRSFLRPAIASVGVLAVLAAVYFGEWFRSAQPYSQAQLKPQQLTAQSSEDPVMVTSVSPDGKYLLYADLEGLHLRLIASGETQMLPIPDTFCFR
jgi:serine/threonine protein kinase